MAERRRLPVLSEKPPPAAAPEEPDDDAPRPPAHWIGFGAVAIFAAWLPLAYIAGAASAKVMASRFGADASKDAIALAMSTMTTEERTRLMAIVALPALLGLAIAAFGGGVIVGRFGSGRGTRDAAYAGAVTATIASVMAWSGPTPGALMGALVTFVIAIGFAAWGGRFGTTRRPDARVTKDGAAPS